MKIILFALLAIALVFAGGIYFNQLATNNGNVFGGNSAAPVDVIGTKVGTSTSPGHFCATSTAFYPTLIGNSMDEAIYTIHPSNASSAAMAVFNVLMSNDAQCDTATTSSQMNAPLRSDIKWQDAGTLIKDLAGSATITTGTSSILWATVNTATAGEIIALENLNARCLGLYVTASGTDLMVQLTTKEK